MMFKRFIGFSMIIFFTAVGLILYLGLVLNPPPVGLAGAPAGVPDTAGQATPALTPQPTPQPTPTPPVAAATTPAPAAGKTPAPVKTVTRTPAPVAVQPTPVPATPAPIPCGSAGGACTAGQVAFHSSPTDCWVVYNSYYFIVTSYVKVHPGGAASFNSQTCGQDITPYMNGSASTAGQTKHVHSTSAYTTLNSYKVGPVRG